MSTVCVNKFTGHDTGFLALDKSDSTELNNPPHAHPYGFRKLRNKHRYQGP